MKKIIKARETMTAKERVRKTFAYEKTDRVTIGYEAFSEIHSRLKNALGAAGDEEVYQALGVDYRNVSAPYVGPELFPPVKDRRIDPLEGSHMRWIEHETGGYWDFCDFPLAGASEKAFAEFPIPNPDHFDYGAALDKAKARGKIYALYAGVPSMPDVINSNSRIAGMEDVLCHLLTGYEPAMAFFKRRAAFQLGVLERVLDSCKGYIDFVWLGEDLGTQIAPMISVSLYRSALKPIHKQFVDLAKSHGLPVLIHSCGSSSWAYEDFIEMGVSGVDTLQPEAVNMSPEFLAARFGGRLNFRGCISTAGPLVFGSTDDITQNCRETLEIMKAVRGYHFAPTHAIQDNTPVDNLLAMYNAAHRYGVYL